jgi:hypothetical protein
MDTHIERLVLRYLYAVFVRGAMLPCLAHFTPRISLHSPSLPPSLPPSPLTSGYAFVEYDNPDTALTAIQNLGNVEVDGRRLRVGFSNNSGLEAIAKQRGLTITPNGGVTGKNLEGVLAHFSLPDMYDMIAHLKEVGVYVFTCPLWSAGRGGGRKGGKEGLPALQ